MSLTEQGEMHPSRWGDPDRATALPGSVLAAWGGATHDGAVATTAPGSALVVRIG